MNPHKLNGAIARGVAFIDTQLARFAAVQRQTEWLDLGQAHTRDSLFFDRQCANRACGTDLATVIARSFAPCPVCNHSRRPKPLKPLFQTGGLQNIVWTRLKTLAASNACLEKLPFRQT